MLAFMGTVGFAIFMLSIGAEDLSTIVLGSLIGLATMGLAAAIRWNYEKKLYIKGRKYGHYIYAPKEEVTKNGVEKN